MADPFSLLELYDKESTYTCAVVFRTHALQCHAAILSGDTKRQKWRIPDVLAKKLLPHLQGRLPTHVFVVHDVHQVVWEKRGQSWNANCLSCGSYHSVSPHPTLCSVFKGRIASVHRIRVGDTTHMYYFELVSDGSSNSEDDSQGAAVLRRNRLYLTYFPMSSSLQLGLRPGA
jgi:hypothetical protein